MVFWRGCHLLLDVVVFDVCDICIPSTASGTKTHFQRVCSETRLPEKKSEAAPCPRRKIHTTTWNAAAATLSKGGGKMHNSRSKDTTNPTSVTPQKRPEPNRNANDSTRNEKPRWSKTSHAKNSSTRSSSFSILCFFVAHKKTL